MTQYNTLNVNLSNSQLNKSKPGTKSGTEVALHISLNLIRNSNDDTNFPHKLLLTGTQASKIREAFANGLLCNIKFSKTQLSVMMQEGGFNNLDMMNTGEVLHKIANQVKDLFNKVSFDEVIKTADISRNFFPDFKGILGTGITLINSE